MPIRLFREYSWAKNINDFLTFPLPRMPQNPSRHLLLRLAKPLAHRYNKDVGRHNKAVSGQAYGSGEYNKENDGEMKRIFRKNSAGKEDLR